MNMIDKNSIPYLTVKRNVKILKEKGLQGFFKSDMSLKEAFCHNVEFEKDSFLVM